MKTLLKTGAPDSLHHYFYLDVIEALPEEITWIHSKEFRYRGDMYDILSRTEENGRILLHCIRDVKESGLFAELDRLVNLNMSGNPAQNNEKMLWHKLFHSLFSPSNDLNHPLLTFKAQKHCTPYSVCRFNAETTGYSPPPELLI
jgi:hypothetical protein